MRESIQKFSHELSIFVRIHVRLESSGNARAHSANLSMHMKQKRSKFSKIEIARLIVQFFLHNLCTFYIVHTKNVSRITQYLVKSTTFIRRYISNIGRRKDH